MKIIQNFDFERLKKGVFPISPKLLMTSHKIAKKVKQAPNENLTISEEVYENSPTSLKTASIGIIGENNEKRLSTNERTLTESMTKSLRVPGYSHDNSCYNSLERRSQIINNEDIY